MAKLDKLSRDELKKAKAEAQAALKAIAKAEAEFDGRRLKELRADIEAMLAKEGFTLAHLFDGKAPKRGAKSATPPKYRHAENASVTWSGRGRQPQWFKDHLAKGGKAEDLAI